MFNVHASACDLFEDSGQALLEARIGTLPEYEHHP
jgi:hypothetical protein